VIEEQYRVGAVPRSILSPTEARAAWQRLPVAVGPEVGEVLDIAIEDAPWRARVYQPPLNPIGTLLYLHGGGWVTGNLDGSDAVCRRLALLVPCNVVSLDYRLAPESPFPAAVEDAWDCLLRLSRGELVKSSAIGPLAVAGFSAGGNLAAVASLMARDAGAPTITHQLLIVPVLDCNFDRESYFENATGLGLETDEMKWFWGHYLADPAKRADWRASPLRADSLAGLPPTSVVVADCDPLRDEGIEFAARLQAAGVPVVCSRWYGAPHGFFGNDLIDAGAMALHAGAAALRRTFTNASVQEHLHVEEPAP